MTGTSQIHGHITPAKEPDDYQMIVMASEINKHELARLVRISLQDSARGTIVFGGVTREDNPKMDSLDFASRLAAMIDHPELGDLNFSGEFVTITDGDPIPFIQRFHVKAGNITYTKGKVVWSRISTIIQPAKYVKP